MDSNIKCHGYWGSVGVYMQKKKKADWLVDKQCHFFNHILIQWHCFYFKLFISSEYLNLQTNYSTYDFYPQT